MEVQQKLEALAAEFDVCGYCGGPTRNISPLRFIHQVSLSGGGTISLLKVLLTNACINDCIYCVNQVNRDIPRSAFQREELARIFKELYEKGLVQGLFLSSGIAANASQTMADMLDTAQILRRRYRYKGYIHLKVMPGSSSDAIEEGCHLASRVSVNIEAPTSRHLSKLTSGKNLYQDILKCMFQVRRIADRNEDILPSGQTTQFVVGAAGESDRDLIRMTRTLYREMGLRRVYFSAFKPVAPEMGNIPEAPPLREHRLYEADWLMRVYKFPPEEIELALDDSGNLPLTRDAKLAIALKQPWRFPVDINRAGYDELIRIPGIGPVSAKRIIQARQEHGIDSVSQLRKIGVRVKAAGPFIWFKGAALAVLRQNFCYRDSPLK